MGGWARAGSQQFLPACLRSNYKDSVLPLSSASGVLPHTYSDEGAHSSSLIAVQAPLPVPRFLAGFCMTLFYGSLQYAPCLPTLRPPDATRVLQRS